MMGLGKCISSPFQIWLFVFFFGSLRSCPRSWKFGVLRPTNSGIPEDELRLEAAKEDFLGVSMGRSFTKWAQKPVISRGP